MSWIRLINRLMGQGEETDLFLQNVNILFVASTDSIVVLCVNFNLYVGWTMTAIVVLVTVTVLKTKHIYTNPTLVVMMVKAKKRTVIATPLNRRAMCVVTRRFKLPQFS